MDLYCYKCDGVVPFVKLDYCEAFTCLACSKYNDYCLRWDQRGYYIVNVYCEAYGASTGIFKNEFLICLSCRNSQCNNRAYFTLVKDKLFAEMEKQFEADESFNPEIWRSTFPNNLKAMYEERKKAIHQHISALKVFPSVIEAVILSYSLTPLI